ncbi:uncharacterized protein LOC142322769 [Lycorma delicatula]|uniref:uncharacterized protein LOC142322769 n=1 Tax=Lycorma delicatula TaxID=130591 RepID=UPI003F516CF9
MIDNEDKRSDFHLFDNLSLRPVSDIPDKYRNVFAAYPYFNAIQSKVLDILLDTDEPLVVSAPTGSGKTVLFELAIIRLLQQIEIEQYQDFKVVYMAPVKALCAERYNDWQTKFGSLGINCLEVTGDFDLLTLHTIQNYHLILTTPEKWDSMTRRWKDHTAVVQLIKLFLIDEVHLLNEDRRGPTLEAVVSRMKTVQNITLSSRTASALRFIAVSATIPNILDVAQWLGNEVPARYEMIGEEMRPVKLNKIVLGFPYNESKSAYYFDMSLSYQIPKVIFRYSEGKPTLIFCSTRKGVQYTSSVLIKKVRCELSDEEIYYLREAALSLSDQKLRDYILAGIGNHHAGISASDRAVIEGLFREGRLPILVTTSTLAMGVNLPAHLVIIKSTDQFIQNTTRPYPEAHILQMMGRAGRPQYDTSATAVIMTKNSCKLKYEKLVAGKQMIESSLHRHLAEHLNAEIVLGTITDVAIAVNWIRSTFFYVRAFHNPLQYGLPQGLSKEAFESKLQDMCVRELNGLSRHHLIEMNEGYDVVATEEGQLMARFYLAFDTMKQFMQVKGTEKLPELLEIISKSSEFSDVRLRVLEKQVLNGLNKKKDADTIRFPLNGRIKTKEQKINCLIQASLGFLTIYDPSLSQEAIHIMRNASRICRGLAVYTWQKSHYRSLVSALQLAKAIHCNMWENSIYVARQLHGIGPALSSLLVMAGKTTFKSISQANPRDLEKILNRHPPFGNNLQESVLRLPVYDLSLSLNNRQHLQVTLHLVNYRYIEENGHSSHKLSLIVGGCNNTVLYKERLTDQMLIVKDGIYCFSVYLNAYQNINEIEAQVISEDFVGLDVTATVSGKVNESTPQIQMVPRTRQTVIDKFMKKKKITPKKKITKEKKQVNQKIAETPSINSNNKRTSTMDIKSFLFNASKNKRIKTNGNEFEEDNDQTVSNACDFEGIRVDNDQLIQTKHDLVVMRNGNFLNTLQQNEINERSDWNDNVTKESSPTSHSYNRSIFVSHSLPRINSDVQDYFCNVSGDNNIVIDNEKFLVPVNLDNQENFYPVSGSINNSLNHHRNLMYDNSQKTVSFDDSNLISYHEKENNTHHNFTREQYSTGNINNSPSESVKIMSNQAKGKLCELFSLPTFKLDAIGDNFNNIVKQICKEYKENFPLKLVTKRESNSSVDDYEKKIFDSICNEYNVDKKRFYPQSKVKKQINTTNKDKLNTKTIPDYLERLFQKNKVNLKQSATITEEEHDICNDHKIIEVNHHFSNVLTPVKEFKSSNIDYPNFDKNYIENSSSRIQMKKNANKLNDDVLMKNEQLYKCTEIITPESTYRHPSLHNDEEMSFTSVSLSTINHNKKVVELNDNNNCYASQLTPYLVLPEDVIDKKENIDGKVGKGIFKNNNINKKNNFSNEGKFYPLFIKNGEVCSDKGDLLINSEVQYNNNNNSTEDSNNNDCVNKIVVENIAKEKLVKEAFDNNDNTFNRKSNNNDFKTIDIIDDNKIEEHRMDDCSRNTIVKLEVDDDDDKELQQNKISDEDNFLNNTVDIFEKSEREKNENKNSFFTSSFQLESIYEEKNDNNKPYVNTNALDIPVLKKNLTAKSDQYDFNKNDCKHIKITEKQLCDTENKYIPMSQFESDNESNEPESNQHVQQAMSEKSFDSETTDVEFSDLDFLLSLINKNEKVLSKNQENRINKPSCIAVEHLDLTAGDIIANSPSNSDHIGSEINNLIIDPEVSYFRPATEVYRLKDLRNKDKCMYSQNEMNISDNQKIDDNRNNPTIVNKSSSYFDSTSSKEYFLNISKVNVPTPYDFNDDKKSQEYLTDIDFPKPNYNEDYRKRLGLPPLQSEYCINLRKPTINDNTACSKRTYIQPEKNKCLVNDKEEIFVNPEQHTQSNLIQMPQNNNVKQNITSENIPIYESVDLDKVMLQNDKQLKTESLDNNKFNIYPQQHVENYYNNDVIRKRDEYLNETSVAVTQSNCKNSITLQQKALEQNQNNFSHHKCNELLNCSHDLDMNQSLKMNHFNCRCNCRINNDYAAGNGNDYEEIILSPTYSEYSQTINKEKFSNEYLSAIDLLKLDNSEENSGHIHKTETISCDEKDINYSQVDIFEQ